MFNQAEQKSQHFKELSTFHEPPDTKITLYSKPISPIRHQGSLSHYITNQPNNALISGKSLKIMFLCIVSCPPKMGSHLSDPLSQPPPAAATLPRSRKPCPAAWPIADADGRCQREASASASPVEQRCWFCDVAPRKAMMVGLGGL